MALRPKLLLVSLAEGVTGTKIAYLKAVLGLCTGTNVFCNLESNGVKRMCARLKSARRLKEQIS